MQEDNVYMIERLTGLPVLGVVREGDTELKIEVETLDRIYSR
jgi:hypothetical protein